MQVYVFSGKEKFLFFQRTFLILKVKIKAKVSLKIKKILLKFNYPCFQKGNFVYLNSGWEWDVYLDSNNHRVIKYPGGIFKKVETISHLNMIKSNYDLLCSYRKNFCVPTEFKFEENIPHIIQRLVVPSGRKFYYRDLTSAQKNSLRGILMILLKLLDKHHWLPDIGLKCRPNYFYTNNLAWNQDLQEFQIFDFAAALDRFRLDPKYTQLRIIMYQKRIKTIIKRLDE